MCLIHGLAACSVAVVVVFVFVVVKTPDENYSFTSCWRNKPRRFVHITVPSTRAMPSPVQPCALPYRCIRSAPCRRTALRFRFRRGVSQVIAARILLTAVVSFSESMSVVKYAASLLLCSCGQMLLMTKLLILKSWLPSNLGALQQRFSFLRTPNHPSLSIPSDWTGKAWLYVAMVCGGRVVEGVPMVCGRRERKCEWAAIDFRAAGRRIQKPTSRYA
ncbi:hypothetical protein IWX90DRAFT_120043 [Phyllosticta citrichinensis]|uniref:Secreted protein n=1 Tax=Phyllosticta citrichinensis TaxID=1130410 RepID=A0ABR1Y3K1_9PEZI